MASGRSLNFHIFYQNHVAAQRKIEMAASNIGDLSQLRKLGRSVVHRNILHDKG